DGPLTPSSGGTGLFLRFLVKPCGQTRIAGEAGFKVLQIKAKAFQAFFLRQPFVVLQDGNQILCDIHDIAKSSTVTILIGLTPSADENAVQGAQGAVGTYETHIKALMAV
ncbi:MAG: hypothetical protein M3Y13_06475, partial [Armatimonadota bacterium]|nr:hypothetical protein [Armatimonadota bacterium]